MDRWLWELLFVIGAASVVAGCAMVYLPLAPIVGGAVLCWIGYRAAPVRGEGGG